MSDRVTRSTRATAAAKQKAVRATSRPTTPPEPIALDDGRAHRLCLSERGAPSAWVDGAPVRLSSNLPAATKKSRPDLWRRERDGHYRVKGDVAKRLAPCPVPVASSSPRGRLRREIEEEVEGEEEEEESEEEEEAESKEEENEEFEDEEEKVTEERRPSSRTAASESKRARREATERTLRRQRREKQELETERERRRREATAEARDYRARLDRCEERAGDRDTENARLRAENAAAARRLADTERRLDEMRARENVCVRSLVDAKLERVSVPPPQSPRSPARPPTVARVATPTTRRAASLLLNDIRRKFPDLDAKTATATTTRKRPAVSLTFCAKKQPDGTYRVGDVLAGYRIVKPYDETRGGVASSSSSSSGASGSPVTKNASERAYIGRGSFGTVYRVVALSDEAASLHGRVPGTTLGSGQGGGDPLALTRTYYALKVVHTGRPHGEISAKMVVEATLMQSLRHPQLMQSKTILLGCDDGGGASVGIVMSLGIGIDDWFRLDYAANEPACLYYVAQELLAGLDHLWTNGVAHRDLKPENIVFLPIDHDAADGADGGERGPGRGGDEFVCGRHWRPVWTDFGTAKKWLDDAAASGQILSPYAGSYQHMPPERLLPDAYLAAETARTVPHSSARPNALETYLQLSAQLVERRPLSSSSSSRPSSIPALVRASSATTATLVPPPHVGFDAEIASDVWSLGGVFHALFFHYHSTTYPHELRDRWLLAFDAAEADATEQALIESETDDETGAVRPGAVELVTRAGFYERIAAASGEWTPAWAEFLASRAVEEQVVERADALEHTTLPERILWRTFRGLPDAAERRDAVMRMYGALRPARDRPSRLTLEQEEAELAVHGGGSRSSEGDLSADTQLANERREIRLAFHRLYAAMFAVAPGERRVPLDELEAVPLMRTFRGARVPLYERPAQRVLLDHSQPGPDDAPGVRLFDERLFAAEVAWVVRDANSLYRRYLAAIASGQPSSPSSRSPSISRTGSSDAIAPARPAHERTLETPWFRIAMLSAAAKRYGRSGLNFLQRSVAARSTSVPAVVPQSPRPGSLGRQVSAPPPPSPPLTPPPQRSTSLIGPATELSRTRSTLPSRGPASTVLESHSAEIELRAVTALTVGLTVEQREDVYRNEKHILAVIGWDGDIRP